MTVGKSRSVPGMSTDASGPLQTSEHTVLPPREQLLADNGWIVAAFVDVVLEFDIQPPFRDTDGFIDDTIRWLIMSARYDISAARAAQCMARNEDYTRSMHRRQNPHDIAAILSTLPYVTRRKFEAEVALQFELHPEPPRVARASGGLFRVGQSQDELESWIASVEAEDTAVENSWVMGCLPKVGILTASE